MAKLAPDSEEALRIDASLREWRQGDLALGESWFVHIGDGAAPLSEAAAEAGEGVQRLGKSNSITSKPKSTVAGPRTEGKKERHCSGRTGCGTIGQRAPERGCAWSTQTALTPF